MVTIGNYAKNFEGRWYSLSEVGDVQGQLIEHCGTGDNWQWVDRNYNPVAFSACNMPKEKRKLNRHERRRKKFGNIELDG